jgi:hypothetical protein
MKRTCLTLAVLLLLLTTVGCQRKGAYLLPNDLVGFWTADDPLYQGRFLELYRAYVIIGTGSAQIPTVQAVNSVLADPEGDHIVYHVLSTDLAGVQYKMTLLYTPAGGGEIRFKHMENITWKRRSEDKKAPSDQSQQSPAHNPLPAPRKRTSAETQPMTR